MLNTEIIIVELDKSLDIKLHTVLNKSSSFRTSADWISYLTLKGKLLTSVGLSFSNVLGKQLEEYLD